MPAEVSPKPKVGLARWFDKFARVTTAATGSTWAFAAALLTVLVWAALGPVFRYSDTWQLVINTGTTIVTFLMVFLIQRSQNRDSLAVQLKLNELIAAMKGASNRLISIEDLSEEDIRRLGENFQQLAAVAQTDVRPGRRHSVDEVAEHIAAAAPEHVRGVIKDAVKAVVTDSPCGPMPNA